jgi:hypothetical protein
MNIRFTKNTLQLSERQQKTNVPESHESCSLEAGELHRNKHGLHDDRHHASRERTRSNEQKHHRQSTRRTGVSQCIKEESNKTADKLR